MLGLAYLLGSSLLRLAGDGQRAAGHHGEGHLERVKRLCLIDEIRPFTQPGGTGAGPIGRYCRTADEEPCASNSHQGNGHTADEETRAILPISRPIAIMADDAGTYLVPAGEWATDSARWITDSPGFCCYGVGSPRSVVRDIPLSIPCPEGYPYPAAVPCACTGTMEDWSVTNGSLCLRVQPSLFTPQIASIRDLDKRRPSAWGSPASPIWVPNTDRNGSVTQ